MPTFSHMPPATPPLHLVAGGSSGWDELVIAGIVAGVAIVVATYVFAGRLAERRLAGVRDRAEGEGMES